MKPLSILVIGTIAMSCLSFGALAEQAGALSAEEGAQLRQMIEEQRNALDRISKQLEQLQQRPTAPAQPALENTQDQPEAAAQQPQQAGPQTLGRQQVARLQALSAILDQYLNPAEGQPEVPNRKQLERYQNNLKSFLAQAGQSAAGGQAPGSAAGSPQQPAQSAQVSEQRSRLQHLIEEFQKQQQAAGQAKAAQQQEQPAQAAPQLPAEPAQAKLDARQQALQQFLDQVKQQQTQQPETQGAPQNPQAQGAPAAPEEPRKRGELNIGDQIREQLQKEQAAKGEGAPAQPPAGPAQ
ncbi:MAG: hypothetical protein HYZ00_08595 [Candidatus Hydrogenedentes bacterium]|nr:hypothetical protein [Candidatus Hydrogenedentota bacterium]